MKLSIEQQKLADALKPHVSYVSPGTRLMIEQLIDRYWQPKPVDVEWIDLSTDKARRWILKDEYHRLALEGVNAEGAAI